MSPTDATKPDDPIETPSARSYEPQPVAPLPQGPRSPGATEPGDIGSERADEAPPHERPPPGGEGYRGG